MFLVGCSSLSDVRLKKDGVLYFLDIEKKRICEDLFDSRTCQEIDPHSKYLVLTEENFFIFAEKLEDCSLK